MNESAGKMLWRACEAAGVSAEQIFSHWNEADIDAYAEALAEGWIPADHLPRWMASTAQTIREKRCLCRKCKAVTA